MKLACQEGLVPGKDLKAKVRAMEKLGFEGIEIWGRELWNRVREIKGALKGSSVRFATVCAGFGGCPLDADPSEREKAWTDIGKILEAAGELGAVGMIFVPIFGKPRINDLRPLADPVKLEKDLLIEYLRTYAEKARACGTRMLLEPLNRYETHLIRRLDDAVEIAHRVDHPGLAIMADFFHMGLEETDGPKALVKAGSLVQHIHLADSTRMQPGTGEKDFASLFSALKKMRYANYMALECGVSGDDRMAALKDCVTCLRNCIKRA